MKKLNFLMKIFLLSSVIVSLTFARFPMVWDVKQDGTGNFTTIQAALDNPNLQYGDDIIVYPGTYNQTVNIDGKNGIDVYASDKNNKPNITLDGVYGKKIVITNSSNILFKDFIIDCKNNSVAGISLQGTSIVFSGCKIVNSVNEAIKCNSPGIKIENCSFDYCKNAITFWSTEKGSLDITGCTFTARLQYDFYAINIMSCPVSHDNLLTVTISGCSIAGDWSGGIRIACTPAPNSNLQFEDWDEGIAAYLNNCSIKASGYGLILNGDFPLRMYLQGTNSFSCGKQNITTSGNYVRIWESMCPLPSCPTYYNTPNYPSNYPNNCNETFILNAPAGASSYYIVVNGITELNYDLLYLYEMDGITLIAKISGSQTNYKKLINTNRSVKVKFVSDGSITKTGYYIKVEKSIVNN